MPTPTLNQSRGLIFGCFLLAFVAQITALVYIRDQMRSSELLGLVIQLLGVYSVHLGVMIGAVFAKNEKGDKRVSPLPFWLALCLVILWNAMFCCFTAVNIFSEASVETISGGISSLSTASVFLVAGVLAYFFAKPGK